MTIVGSRPKKVAICRFFRGPDVNVNSISSAFWAKAGEAGYRVYLHFIATEDPEINVNRVRIRVAQSGHAVNPEIIRKRYHKSLANLKKAILLTSRAYLFDNSGAISKLVATIMNSSHVEIIDRAETPNWIVKYLTN